MDSLKYYAVIQYSDGRLSQVLSHRGEYTLLWRDIGIFTERLVNMYRASFDFDGSHAVRIFRQKKLYAIIKSVIVGGQCMNFGFKDVSGQARDKLKELNIPVQKNNGSSQWDVLFLMPVKVIKEGEVYYYLAGEVAASWAIFSRSVQEDVLRLVNDRYEQEQLIEKFNRVAGYPQR